MTPGNTGGAAPTQTPSAAEGRYRNEGLRGLLGARPQPARFVLANVARWNSEPVFDQITDAFDRLGVTATVVVTDRATVEAAAGEGAFAAYDPNTDTIMLLDTSLDGANAVHALFHEATHALTLHAIRLANDPRYTTPQLRADVARLNELFQQASREVPAAFDDGAQGQWRLSLEEFIAEVWSNPRLREQLESMPTPTSQERGAFQSLWDAIVDAVYAIVAPGKRRYRQLNCSRLGEIMDSTERVFAPSRGIQAERADAGRAAPMRDARARADDMMRQMVEAARNLDQPRAPDSQTNQAETAEVAEQVEQSNRPHYYGERNEGGKITKRGAATPMGDGRWRATTTDGFDGVYDSADDAIQALRDNGITAKLRSEATARNTGHAFVDEYAKASPVIRTLANAVKRAIGLYDTNSGEVAGLRTLDMLGSLMAKFGTQFYFLDRMDRAAEQMSGVNPELSLRVRSIMRQIAVVGRSDELGGAIRKVRQLVTQSGVTDMAEASTYLVARHVVERNARYAGKPRPDGTGMYGPDVTGFTYKGQKGDAAAKAFLAELTPDKRAVLDAVGDTYDFARQRVLEAQYRSGLIDVETFRAMGGAFAGETPSPGTWRHYVRMIDGRSGLANRPGRGGVSGGQGDHTVDYTRALDVGFADLERQMKAALRNSAHLEMANTARDFPQLMDVRIQSQKGAPKVGASRAGDGLAWNAEDFVGDKSLVFFENGQRKTMTFADPTALAYVKARQATPNVALRTMGAVTHLMAATRTTFAPAFWAQAAAWDVLMSVLGMEYAAAGTLTPRESLSVSRRTLSLMLPNFRKLVGRAATHATDDPFLKVYGANGGGVAPGARTGIDEMTDRWSETASPLATGLAPGDRARATASRFMQVLHTSEDMARFSAFQAYIEHKAGQKFSSHDRLQEYLDANPNVLNHALEVSRRITGDFADRGAEAWPRAVFMFFNPAVAGARQLTGVAQTTSGQLGLLALFSLGMATAAGFLDSEDDEDLDGGSKYLRRSDAGRAMRITEDLSWPLAPEGRAVFRAGEMVAALGLGRVTPGEAISTVAGSIVDSFFPLNMPDADVPIESAAYGLAPAVLQPVITAAFGVNSWGSPTEIDANLVRTPDGGRVPHAANAERGRARDPQWIKDASMWLNDNTGVDLYPGRVWEVLRTFGGSTLTYAQRSVDEGVVSATTRSFQSRPDDFAIRNEFENVASQFEQELRALERSRNPIQVDPVRARNTLLMREAEEMARSVTVNGMSQSQLFRARDYYRAAGHTEGVAAADQAIANLREAQDHVRAAALRQVMENSRE